MIFEHINEGTCSRKIVLNIEDNVILDCKFIGGCSGNTQGISKLVKGKNIDEIISLLDGIHCGFKSTSCPDQLAKALIEYKENI